MSTPIKTVWIDNPPLNALDAATVERLEAELGQIEVETRVVVLRGRGRRAFSVGADVSELHAGTLPGIQDLAGVIESLPVPAIAALDGYCLGGGLELALACDIRIAHTDAKLGLPEVKLGLVPGGGGTQRLPRLVGPGRAAWLLMSGEQVSASRAEAWGLVERVTDELDAEIAAVAGMLAGQSRHALLELKRVLLDTRHAPSDRTEFDAFVRCLEAHDGKERIAAFLEKRTPSWS